MRSRVGVMPHAQTPRVDEAKLVIPLDPCPRVALWVVVVAVGKGWPAWVGCCCCSAWLLAVACSLLLLLLLPLAAPRWPRRIRGFGYLNPRSLFFTQNSYVAIDHPARHRAPQLTKCSFPLDPTSRYFLHLSSHLQIMADFTSGEEAAAKKAARSFKKYQYRGVELDQLLDLNNESLIEVC